MNEATGPDPIIARRRLRSRLRRAREQAGRTQAETREAMDWSLSKMIRIESGGVSISTNDVRALLAFYGLPEAEVAELAELARATRAQTSWNAWRADVSQEYLYFLSFESAASVIRNFEPLLVPGLLQTEDYARAVISKIGLDRSDETIDSLVDLRVQRQEVLTKNGAPRAHFILDEAVIRRLVGDLATTRKQLQHLLATAEQQENVTIRVVPFTAGIYTGMRGPYVLFEFPDEDDAAVLYLEDPNGEVIVREDPDSPPSTDEVQAKNEHWGPIDYLEDFWQSEQLAPVEQSIELIKAALSDLPT